MARSLCSNSHRLRAPWRSGTSGRRADRPASKTRVRQRQRQSVHLLLGPREEVEGETHRAGARGAKDHEAREAATAVASTLVPKVITITAKASPEGKLFGSVSAADVADALTVTRPLSQHDKADERGPPSTVRRQVDRGSQEAAAKAARVDCVRALKAAGELGLAPHPFHLVRQLQA